jgi:murein DD-endopeptidase MepM/ murein hydrolase activator NlpD
VRRRRRSHAAAARGLAHLSVVALVAGCVSVGVLSAQGVIAVDGTSIRLVAPAQAAVSEQTAQALDESFTASIEPEIRVEDPVEAEDEAMVEARAQATPPPDMPVAIILPPPPAPVRSSAGAVGPSIPWAGATGYVDGDGSLTWPVPGGYVSQYFWGGHLGLDIAHNAGGAVIAADTGTVTQAGWVNNGGGMVITIAHSDGRVTQYNHLGSILVSVGQGVVRGQQIAIVGCTGWCTGPHVHFVTIVNNVIVNPLRYL